MSAWDGILGNPRIVGTLQRAVREDRPHHAYLLLGPEGLGKMSKDMRNIYRTVVGAPCWPAPRCSWSSIDRH